MQHADRAWKVIAVLLMVAVSTMLMSCTPDAPSALGKGLQIIEAPGAAYGGQPHLAVGTHGEVVLSWLETDAGVATLQVTQLRDSSWQAPSLVASGDNWFVNWADFPSVVPIDGDLWAAHWLVKRPGGAYSYDVALSVSRDAGLSWSSPVIPHLDNTPTEHGFVSLFAHANGVGAVWLDGRDSGGADHDHHNTDAQMTLRTAVLERDLTVTRSALLDERVCDCCQTDAAATPSGPLLVYRDRSADEVRDIALVRGQSGSWQAPATLAADHWRINGCPVNGPALDSQGRHVAVAWYTGAADTPRVRLTHSFDGGVTFSEPIEVDGGAALGRVDVVALADGGAVVSWIRGLPDDQAALMVRRFGRDGRSGRALSLVPISRLRASGFPQMVRRGKDLVFAWTEVGDQTTRIRTAVLEDAAAVL